jgi:hypothetical protein
MNNINKMIMESYRSSILKESDGIEVYRAGSLEGKGIIWFSTDEELSKEYGASNDVEVDQYNLEGLKSFPIRKSEIERTLTSLVLDIINFADGEGVNFDDEFIVYAKKVLKIKTTELQLFQLWDKYYEELKHILRYIGFNSIKTTEGGVVTYGVFDTENVVLK